MAFGTALGILHRECLLAVVARTAELSLAHRAHLRFERAACHLKYLIMTVGARECFSLHVPVMAEYHLFGIFRVKNDVPASYGLRVHPERQCDTQNNMNTIKASFMFPPFLPAFKRLVELYHDRGAVQAFSRMGRPINLV